MLANANLYGVLVLRFIAVSWSHKEIDWSWKKSSSEIYIQNNFPEVFNSD